MKKTPVFGSDSRCEALRHICMLLCIADTGDPKALRHCQVGIRSISSLKLPRKSSSGCFKRECSEKSVTPYVKTKHWLPFPLCPLPFSPFLSHQMYHFSSKRKWDTTSVMRNISKDDIVGFPCLLCHGNFQDGVFQAHSSCPLAAPFFW